MDSNFKVTMSEYLPLRDVVFNTLRTAILKGELEPGERLMEKQLADKMGVSRTPIREAIRKLELEGLVVMVPRKGAEVAQITKKDIHDVLVVRAALEGLAIKLACENMDAAHIEELSAIKDAFSEAAKKKDVETVIAKDIEFHDFLYSVSNNEKLVSIINNLSEQIYRFRVEYIRSMDDFSGLVQEHEELVSCLADKRVDEANRLATIHIQNQEKAVIDHIKL